MADDSDDDRTPPRHRPRRHQTQDDRDREGYAARRERDARARDQVDELADVSDDAVPQRARWEDERTQPVIFDEDGRACPIELSKEGRFLNGRIDRLKGETRRGKKSTADQIAEAMGKRPPNERLTRLETRLKIVLVVLGAIGTAALGAVVTVAQGLYSRGETDGAHEQRLLQVERELHQLEQMFPFTYQPRHAP